MLEVPLGGKDAAGRVALIDAEDFELISRYRWYLSETKRPGRSSGPYAKAGIWLPSGRQSTVRMHNLILGCKGVDHRNGNGLDNQKSNLRIATASQNNANRNSFLGSSSAYKGVAWHRNIKQWQAYIQVDGQTRHLGYHTSEEDAARAYDTAALEVFGEFAHLNFPNLVAPGMLLGLAQRCEWT